MELSPQFINELLINFGGYFIAGVLGALFYAVIFSRRKAKTATVASTANITASQTTQENINSTSSINSDMEFIKLGENKSRLPEQVQSNLSENRKTIGSRRQNRLEIINLAKTMLKTGATIDNIKKVLPVSEAEMNLIKMNNN